MITVPPDAPTLSASRHPATAHSGTWLSAGIVTGLWLLCLLDLCFGAWLLAVTHGAAACSGLPCTVATLGDHPMWALGLADGCAALLVVLIPVNSGRAHVGGLRLAAILAAAIGGMIALVGAAALFVGAAAILIAVAAIVLHVIDSL
jgi:hypothetical protein